MRAPHVTAIGMAMAIVLAGGRGEADPVKRCERVSFAVALAEGQPADQMVVGWLCARGTAHNKTLQVTLHGGAYDHNYWDFPLSPETYSYVDVMLGAGYAVLNLDRLGDGESSRPVPGIAFTMHTGAFAVHQVVQALRGGVDVHAFGRIRPERIELVGHSLGSFIATIEAGTYDDVDGLILTGYSHTVGPEIAALNGSLLPAAFDPKFAALGLPFDYFTTAPGARAGAFYYVPNADPAVIALDEQLRQTVTLGELIDTPTSYAASFDVRVPTLEVVGEYDRLVCLPPTCTASGSLVNEAATFPQAADFELHAMPDNGHDTNLHRNAQDWYAIALDWSNRHFGPYTNR